MKTENSQCPPASPLCSATYIQFSETIGELRNSNVLVLRAYIYTVLQNKPDSSNQAIVSFCDQFLIAG